MKRSLSPKTPKEAVRSLLAHAGIEIGGSKPWDIQVVDERFYARVFTKGSLGLGESYMDGWWDAPALDEFFTKIIAANIESKLSINFSLATAFIKERLKQHLFNAQNKKRALVVGEKHYDIGNDLYEKMLGERLVYTCGYWKDAKTLAEAQENKLDLICKKIGLKPGQRVLDIGCGWGSFLKFAAERYGVTGVGITISKEQAALAREQCKGLPVEIRLQDYRDINEKFDHIISIGMFEHVGMKNYRTYMKVAERCLKDDGFFLLHTIGGLKSVRGTDKWIEKYIFPNSMLPSIAQMSKAIEGLFVIEDIHNFGADYDTTLMAWFHNFDAAWPLLQTQYTMRFYRMWKYYLLMSAGSFRSRKNQLWQFVLSKKGVKGVYKSIR